MATAGRRNGDRHRNGGRIAVTPARLAYGACYAAFYGAGPPVEVPFLARLVDAGGSRREVDVLDLGCGTGRLLGPLAALGWQVVGMEPEADNLAEACEVGARTPGVVAVVAGGFEDLRAAEAFDVVVAAGGPWWYLQTRTQRVGALVRVRRALRPGGLVVLDGPNLSWILDHYRAPQPSETTVGGILVRRTPRHHIDTDRRIWTHTDHFLASSGEELTMVHRLAIIPAAEVLAALEEAGFGHVEAYRSWASTSPEPPDGPRVIAVGRVTGPS